jgi:hypothetical protein
MLSGFKFSSTDREDLERRGISAAEALDQLAMLASARPAVALERACRLGDGITVLDPARWSDLERVWRDSVADLRVVKFVPASGAATRMFSFLSEAGAEFGDSSRSELERAARKGFAPASQVLELAERHRSLPFAPALESLAVAQGLEFALLEARPLVLGARIAGSPGLGLADLPKGLIPFHQYATNTRTAFEEHLHEAAGYAVSRGVAAAHFTVTPEHRVLFEETTSRVVPALEESIGVEFAIAFSVQDPSTDTLALAVGAIEGEPDGPLRSESGRLVFRPSGHGALIANLSRLEADIVFIKNIDNVAPERSHPEIAAWKRRLGGHLLELRRRSFELLDRLDRQDRADPQGCARVVADALAFCRGALALGLPESIESESLAARRAFLLDRLDRPLRVCGMVENVGEPGGGPFWLASQSRIPPGHRLESGQIVEASQIDARSESQAEILAGASHFNPVDLVCALTDRRGQPYELSRFTDPSASFVASKNEGGRPIRALERPGLWNGAMAGWNTAFVEVPLATFTPVKTILDLTRPEHQTRAPSRD